MANNKSYFSIFADDFKLMKTELTAEEILDMMSALSDMCMWGETGYIPKTSKQTYFWEKLKAKFDCDTDIYKKKSEAGKIGMYNRWHNKTDNTPNNKSDNKQDNTIHNKRDNHLTPNTLTPNSNIPPVSKDTSPQMVVRFQKPTLEEVKAYCEERNNGIDPQHWMDYYTSNGWKVGKNPMKDWKATVRTWERFAMGEKKQHADPESGVLIEQGTFYLDDTIPEYHEACKNLTDDEQERAWKWIMEHFEGKRLTVDFINNVLKKFDTSTQFRQAQGV